MPSRDRTEQPALWPVDHGPLRLRFTGRHSADPEATAADWLAELAPPHVELAWLRQVHSGEVLAARPGACGAADALVTRSPHLALAIATADCVPVAILGDQGRALAVAHAGWRGIVAGVVSRAVEALHTPPFIAWIGPAIGPCCYEVGEEVAGQVVEASGPAVADRSRGSRPFLDLPLAVELQLREAGVERVERTSVCTRCHPDLLWSYRRDGAAAGRNYLLAWLV